MNKNIKKNKKGNEKTIEIFVSLFLILAVAMILLKMFSGQVADKTNELNQVSETQASLQLCADACSKAKSNNCRTEDLIGFCKAKYELDLDKDSMIGEYNKGAFKICEDSIYCPLEVNCICNRELTMAECLKITKKYYKDNNIDLKNIGKLYKYTDGVCTVNSSDILQWQNFFNVTKYTIP